MKFQIFKDILIVITCLSAIDSFIDLSKASKMIHQNRMCVIALSPEEYIKENKKLMNYIIQEQVKKRCGK